MKSKFYFIIIASIFITTNLLSQEYHPLLNNSAWTVDAIDNGSQTFSILANGEQIIAGHTYKKFADPYYGNEHLIREDVLAKKVYKIINGADAILFDFNLEVADVITLSDGLTYIVTSITDINVNGGQRKRFNLTNQSQSFPYNEVWIEGVGNWEHPLLARYEYGTDPSFFTRCSYQNGEIIYNMGLANNGVYSECDMLSVTEYNADGTIIFSPNPFQNEITITTENPLKNASLKMYNMMGQEVKSMKNINGKIVVLSPGSLATGTYLIRIQTEKAIINRKVIIEN